MMIVERARALWADRDYQIRRAKQIIAASAAAAIEKAKAMFDDAQHFVARKVFRRRMSYRAVFLAGKDKLSPAGRAVLADLTKFCYGLTSTIMVSSETKSVDPYASAVAQGRREVWCRLMKELGLDPADVLRAVKDDDAQAA